MSLQPTAYLLGIFGTLACCAYLHARALSAFVDGELVSFAPGVRGVLRKNVAPQTSERALPSSSGSGASAVLARNPFDSRVGPLREVAAVVPGERSAQPVTKPLQAPLCEGVFVYGTTESSDPLWSLAVVQGPGEKHGHQRRVGSIVGDFSVAFIGYNPIKRTPSVWLMGDSGLCQAVLFDGKPRGNSANARKPAQPVKKAPQKPRGKAAVLPKEIASKIRNVSENEVWIDRAAVDQIFESYAQLVRGTRIIPARDKDRVKALRLARIRQGTLLDKLGLKNNDQVQSINGFSLTNPASALQAYARLRTATDLKLKLIRGGKPMLIDFRIR